LYNNEDLVRTGTSIFIGFIVYVQLAPHTVWLTYVVMSKFLNRKRKHNKRNIWYKITDGSRYALCMLTAYKMSWHCLYK